MKRLAFTLFIALAACGAQSLETHETAPPSSSDAPAAAEQPEAEPPEQPFEFVEVGNYLQGLMPIDIEALPSGRFVVATRDGNVIMLNSELLMTGHSAVPVNTFWDSGLFSIVPDGGRLYVGATLEACPDPETFCNGVLAYDFDETAEDPLSNPEVVFSVAMPNRNGQHNGGAMVMDDEGFLLFGVGDGEYPATGDNSAQDDGSQLGKILRLDPLGVEAPEIIAKGLRNPFTAVTVPSLGMLIGDVGNEWYEEMDLLPYDSGLLNFGWPLEEGPTEGSDFAQPIAGLKHCDLAFEDEDPFGHDGIEGKTLTVKNHAGVVHECGFAVITAAGFYDGDGPDPYGDALDRTAIYSQAYYGYIRGVTLDDAGNPGEDRHLAHFPGLSALTTGPDGYLYGVSIFASNYVLKLVPKN